MKILVPTNFDINYSDYFSGSANEEIAFYGRMPKDEIGSIFDVFLKNGFNADIACIKKFIGHIKPKGIKFYYLMDAVCLDNTEVQRKPHHKIIDTAAKIVNAGADGFIVSSLMLMQMIKSHFPQVKIIISPGLRIDSFQAAASTIKEGADSIVYSFFVSRDLEFLDMALSEFNNIDNYIYLNNGCYLKSIYCVRHLSELSHFSQNFIRHEMQKNDYGGLLCAREKITNPEKHLSAAYLAPANMGFFRDKFPDLNYFLSDADGTFESVKTVFDAYFRQKQPDNLFSVIKNYMCLAGIKFNSLRLSAEKASEILNERLAVKNSCSYIDCAKCGKCLDYFTKNADFDKSEQTKLLKELDDEINSTIKLG